MFELLCSIVRQHQQLLDFIIASLILLLQSVIHRAKHSNTTQLTITNAIKDVQRRLTAQHEVVSRITLVFKSAVGIQQRVRTS